MRLVLLLLLFCLKGAAMPSSKPLPLFSETFGNKTHPAIILNAGAACQSITWPDAFCRGLAERGYFVIRYDYRDTGESPSTDYEKNPYTIMDLSQDVVGILKKYGIKKATCVGFSMGGQICQFLGAYFPDVVDHLVLLGTSTDFKTGFDALEGRPQVEKLSPPIPAYVAFCRNLGDATHLTLEEKIERYVEFQRWLMRHSPHFDESFFRNQARLSYARARVQSPYTLHAQAMKASFADHARAPALITAPTLIIQGGQDPVFPPDHGEDLHQKIKGSQLIVWDDFSHLISPYDCERIINAIDDFIRPK